jgi:hypothetical protein
VISLRQRLLSIADQHASELLNISDEREMNLRLDSIVRDALSEISDMPLKVVDENWLEKLDGNEASKRPRRATSSASTLVPQGAAFSRPG